MVNLFGAEVPQHRPHGLLNVSIASVDWWYSPKNAYDQSYTTNYSLKFLGRT